MGREMGRSERKRKQNQNIFSERKLLKKEVLMFSNVAKYLVCDVSSFSNTEPIQVINLYQSKAFLLLISVY